MSTVGPRLFIVGAPKGSPIPELPSASHGGPWERRVTGWGIQPHVSVGAVLEGLTTEPEDSEQIRGRWGHLLPEVPPGDNYLHFTAKRGHPTPIFEWRSRYWSFLLKLDPTRPSPTIQAQPGPNVGPFHWDNRRLRVAEVKRLSPSLTTSPWSAPDRRYSRSSATRYRRCSLNASPKRSPRPCDCSRALCMRTPKCGVTVGTVGTHPTVGMPFELADKNIGARGSSVAITPGQWTAGRSSCSTTTSSRLAAAADLSQGSPWSAAPVSAARSLLAGRGAGDRP
jgi:hypothetical protein